MLELPDSTKSFSIHAQDSAHKQKHLNPPFLAGQYVVVHQHRPEYKNNQRQEEQTKQKMSKKQRQILKKKKFHFVP